ncbi:TPA: nucleotidyltransferase family protein, partial [Listeria monocytogenes]|nr:nucleotidyltransferase family protein [Listeria monocytogenes]
MILVEEIEYIQRFGKEKNEEITLDKAFNILVLQYYCYKEKELELVWNDIINFNITDGKNDGGIDFVYFDDEDSKVIVGQSKNSSSVDVNECVSEINKVVDTIINFGNGQTGKYNEKVKIFLQNSLDRLTDETFGNVEIVFSSLSDFKKNNAMEKLEMAKKEVSEIEIQHNEDIVALIAKVRSQDETVKESSFELDKANNFLEYESGGIEGAFVNISSKSLIQAYNKFH